MYVYFLYISRFRKNYAYINLHRSYFCVVILIQYSAWRTDGFRCVEFSFIGCCLGVLANILSNALKENSFKNKTCSKLAKENKNARLTYQKTKCGDKYVGWFYSCVSVVFKYPFWKTKTFWKLYNQTKEVYVCTCSD